MEAELTCMRTRYYDRINREREKPSGCAGKCGERLDPREFKSTLYS